MKDEEIIDKKKAIGLPSTWSYFDFSDVFNVIPTTNKKLKQKEYKSKGKLPVIDQGISIIGGYTDIDSFKISVENPMIIFGDHTKCFKYITFNFVPGADGIKILQAKNELDPLYIFYSCKIADLPNKGYARHFSFLKKYKFPIAPLNEQKRIVDKIEKLFSGLDDAEANLKKVQSLIKTYRQSVLKAAVTGQLTKEWRKENKSKFEGSEDLLKRILKARREQWKGKYKEPEKPDFSILPKLPQGWSWISLDQIVVDIQAGKNYRCDERPPINNEYGIVKISSVTWGKFNEEESKTITNTAHIRQDFLIHTGDFLFTRANTLELVGASAIVETITKKLLLSDKVLRFQFAIDIRQWVDSCLKSNLGRKQIENLATGNQLSMRNISQDNIRKIAIPLPPFVEIERINESISQAESMIDNISSLAINEYNRSNILRQSILKYAFSGQLVPQDPNDEPANKLLNRIQANELITEKRKPVKDVGYKKTRSRNQITPKGPLPGIKKVKQ